MASDDVHRDLPVKLTEAELLKFGDEMADAEMRIGQLKLKRKDLNAKITEQRDERKRLGTLIDDGTEPRKVVCRWVEDLAHQCKRLVRQDTGDVVDTQALTADDLQEGMFDDDEDPDLDAIVAARPLRQHLDASPGGELHDDPEGPEDGDDDDLDAEDDADLDDGDDETAHHTSA